MSSKCRKKKIQTGIIVGSVGLGLMLAVIIPFWGWIFVAGAGLIYFGWCLIKNH